MKLSIRFINNRELYYVRIFSLLLLTVFVVSMLISGKTNAIGVSNELAALTEDEYFIYSQNDIYFVAPGCTSTSSPSSICGDTAKEMYWSALSQYIDDPVKIAGVLGNLLSEGNMNPVAWEGAITNGDGTLKYSWDEIYHGALDGSKGVGAFGITSGLSDYLHFINDNAPDLLKYFQRSQDYGFNYVYTGSGANPTFGDTLLDKIGKDEFAKLVELEVKYAMEDFSPDRTQAYIKGSFSSPSQAAYAWMSDWERPDPKYAHADAREQYAMKVYDELKNFTCASGSSNATTNSATSGIDLDITLIGDSIAVQSEAELRAKFPGAFMSKVGSRHSTSKGKCDGDEGGLDILKKIASGSGDVADQHANTENCYRLKVDTDSLNDNVIWELGTNTYGADEDTIKKVIATIGQRKLFLVTPYNGNNDRDKDGISAMEKTDTIAGMYRKVAEENDAVYVVDWNEAVRLDPEKYISADGFHPTEEGRKLLAELIAEAVEGKASCAIASYKHPAYKKRLDELENFNQWRGPWSSHEMCPGIPGTHSMGDGCGLMSMFAMYYMFSGKGLKDDTLLNGFLEATMIDEFNTCAASNGNNWGELSTKYTGMSLKEEDIFWTGRNYEGESDWNTLVNALKQGKKILIGTTGPDDNGPSKFGHGGHYIFFDHYNAEKDEIYLYDPSMSDERFPYVTEKGPTNDYYDGVYVDKEAMERWVVPDEAFAFTYQGQDCMVCEDEETGLVAGGMTYEQAVKFMEPYVKEAALMKRGDYGAGFPNGGLVIGSGWVSDAGCDDGTLNNCVAFSQWFVNNYTTSGPLFGTNDGNGYVDTMISGGFTDGGSIPRAYAVFSTGFNELHGHTGVVLGIDKEKNEIYIGQAGCGGYKPEAGWPGVHVESLSEYTSTAYKYAYTDGKLKSNQELTSSLSTSK